MKRTQHTPGPWKVVPSAEPKTHDEDIMGNGFHIAEIVPFDGIQDRANSALIAAAPDLAAALGDIARMPCITALLGENDPESDRECGCARCVAVRTLRKAGIQE